MTATIELSHDEVIKACQAYVIANGFKVEDQGKLTIYRGGNDGPYESADTVTYEVKVKRNLETES